MMNHLIQQFLCLFSVIHCIQIAPGYWLCLFPCTAPVLFNVCQLEVQMKYCIEYVSPRNKDRKNLNVTKRKNNTQFEVKLTVILLQFIYPIFNHIVIVNEPQWHGFGFPCHEQFLYCWNHMPKAGLFLSWKALWITLASYSNNSG